MKVNVFNLIILDESGSMESIKKPALSGLNETLQSIQTAQQVHQELQQHFVSLISFNSGGIKTLFDKVAISEIRSLTDKDYQPNNNTPLFDAIGYGLTNLRSKLKKNEKNQVLVTIITDGYENASNEYSGNAIKSLVQKLREAGWVFTYIGTNQDVDAVADSLSINNRLFFDYDECGTGMMMEEERLSRGNFYNKVSERLFDESIDLQKDYFQKENGNLDKKANVPEKPKETKGFSLKNLFRNTNH
jgi:hypothetical protein